MLTRREFILRTFEYGGFGAIAMMGLEREARAWGILPSFLGGVSSLSWTNWDQETESALANNNRLVWVAEGGAADHEYGVNGSTATGDDLKLTQVGGIPAVSSGTRQLDGTSMYFTMNGNGRDQTIKGQNAWSIVWRIDDWTYQARYDAIINWAPDANNQIMFRWDEAATPSKITMYFKHNATLHWNAASTDDLDPTKRIYGGIFSDGSKLLMGWTEGQTLVPTKASDFDAGKCKTATASADLSSFTFNDGDMLFNDTSSPTRYAKVKFKFFIIARECFIDLNA